MRFAILAGALALILAPILAPAAQAAVIGSGPTGFKLEMSVRVSAPPDRVWAAILKPGDWWNPEHTYSSNAANMTIAPVAGGCWCEKWSGGSIEHMRVIYVVPGKTLRMSGGLGPLQEMGIVGVMTWSLSETAGGATTMTLTYAAGGYSARGFDGISPAVDGVLTEQMNRLQLFLQTGSPTARATQ